MSKILRQREFVADDWVPLSEQPPAEGMAVIVPFAKFRESADRWRAWQGRLGLRLAPADKVEDLAPYVSCFALIALEFTGPGEGRGYSQAKLLRKRYGFRGELRAVGHVKRDQLYLMSRCGIDSFELASTERPEEALAALERFKVAYTPGAPIPSLTRERFYV
jgi:uncharacterized protein (DUF934 family)